MFSGRGAASFVFAYLMRNRRPAPWLGGSDPKKQKSNKSKNQLFSPRERDFAAAQLVFLLYCFLALLYYAEIIKDSFNYLSIFVRLFSDGSSSRQLWLR